MHGEKPERTFSEAPRFVPAVTLEKMTYECTQAEVSAKHRVATLETLISFHLVVKLTMSKLFFDHFSKIYKKLCLQN